MIHGGATVVARAVSKVHGSGPVKTHALSGVDLTISPGEFVALMGPSGSGKSTLLHLLGGRARPTSGSVCIDGVDLASLNDDARTLLRRRRIGLVFQSYNLVESLTAEENVALPLALEGVGHAETARRARRVIAEVGLTARLRHRPGELSGGEQQRLAVARALVIEPTLLLADEPTGNLDSVAAATVLSLLQGLASQRRRTIVLVTHDPAQGNLADRRVWLRDGRLVPSEMSDAVAAGTPVLAAGV